MDEIDAALDFKNVSIIANYVKERTRDAQFVIISLRNNMFELADRLVRVPRFRAHAAALSRTTAQLSPIGAALRWVSTRCKTSRVPSRSDPRRSPAGRSRHSLCR